jgi:hypothetical protein
VTGVPAIGGGDELVVWPLMNSTWQLVAAKQFGAASTETTYPLDDKEKTLAYSVRVTELRLLGRRMGTEVVACSCDRIGA